MDAALKEPDAGEAEALAAALGIDRSRPLIVAGSTGPGEEEVLLRGLPEGCQLLLAPRRRSGGTRWRGWCRECRGGVGVGGWVGHPKHAKGWKRIGTVGMEEYCQSMREDGQNMRGDGRDMREGGRRVRGRGHRHGDDRGRRGEPDRPASSCSTPSASCRRPTCSPTPCSWGAA